MTDALKHRALDELFKGSPPPKVTVRLTDSACEAPELCPNGYTRMNLGIDFPNAEWGRITIRYRHTGGDEIEIVDVSAD